METALKKRFYFTFEMSKLRPTEATHLLRRHPHLLSPGPHHLLLPLPPRRGRGRGAGRRPRPRGVQSAVCPTPGLPFPYSLAGGWRQSPICSEGLGRPPKLPGKRTHLSGCLSGAAPLKVPTPGPPCPPAVCAGADCPLGSPRLNNAFLRLNVAVFSISEGTLPSCSLCRLCVARPSAGPSGLCQVPPCPHLRGLVVGRV